MKILLLQVILTILFDHYYHFLQKQAFSTDLYFVHFRHFTFLLLFTRLQPSKLVYFELIFKFVGNYYGDLAI